MCGITSFFNVCGKNLRWSRFSHEGFGFQLHVHLPYYNTTPYFLCTSCEYLVNIELQIEEILLTSSLIYN